MAQNLTITTGSFYSLVCAHTLLLQTFDHLHHHFYTLDVFIILVWCHRLKPRTHIIMSLSQLIAESPHFSSKSSWLDLLEILTYQSVFMFLVCDVCTSCKCRECDICSILIVQYCHCCIYVQFMRKLL